MEIRDEGGAHPLKFRGGGEVISMKGVRKTSVDVCAFRIFRIVSTLLMYYKNNK